MKSKILYVILSGFSIIMQAQPKEIPVSMDMFVQMVFKSPIQNVKSGNPENLLIESSENSLTMQALSNDFRTNISVKTSDGLYYSYVVTSTEERNLKLFYEVSVNEAVNLNIMQSTSENKNQKSEIENTLSSQDVAEKIYHQRGFIKNRNVAKYKKIYLKIKAIYSHKEKIYFLLELSNKSNISYKIEKLQYLTLPIDKSKRRIQSEEKEYIPLFYYNNQNIIDRKSKIVLVSVFNKFTLNDNKNLEITLTEDGGERTIHLIIPSDWISNARQL